MADAEAEADEIDRLRTDYGAHTPVAQRLIECLGQQLTTLLKLNGITLGVPMETRVKSWESVSEKLKRKALSLESICELEDMAGIRLILLFRDDLAKMDEILRANLDVVRGENTADRLDDTQFGYQSNHYIVRIPERWAELPSYSGLRSLTAEIQVRTVAQHIWAAASHKLQYKREASVPPALRRTIHRVSALLETVDLEFSRVLAERDHYLATAGDDTDLPLNVDSLVIALPLLLPAKNQYPTDDYDELLAELQDLGITTSRQLKLIIEKHRDAVLADERRILEEYAAEGCRPTLPWLANRVDQGVYFTLVGLARKALREEFGEEKMNALLEKYHHRHTHPELKRIGKPTTSPRALKRNRSITSDASRQNRVVRTKSPKGSQPKK